MVLLGYQYTAALQSARSQVFNRIYDGLQRIHLVVERDLTAGSQFHQFDEIDVRTYLISNDTLLLHDEVDRRHLHRPAVADHEVQPAASQHGAGILLGPVFTDEVEYRIGADPSGELFDLVDLPAVGDHYLVSAELRASSSAGSSGSTTITRVVVRAFRHCSPMCPRPPAPITTAVVPGTKW